MRRMRSTWRCSQGHLFSHGFLWFSPGAKLGFARDGHCPVGNHWALVKRVNDSNLTEAERQTVKR
jgi:hypothetical protein